MARYAWLGDIQLDLITYFDSLESTSRVNYAEHEVIEGKPRLQYIGEALDEITIKISLHTGFCKPEEELKKIKEAMKKYEPLDFIFASGAYKGKYVIEEITSTVIQTFEDGTVQAIEATLKLKEWVQDRPLEYKKEAKKKAQQKKKTVKKTEFTTVTEKNKEGIEFKKIVRQ